MSQRGRGPCMRSVGSGATTVLALQALAERG